MALRLCLNGEHREFPSPLTVDGLLAQLSLHPAKVAAARHLEILPRSTSRAVPLIEGDRLEIVQFIGGGNDMSGATPIVDRPFVVAGRELKSRLIIGPGKYKSYAE